MDEKRGYIRKAFQMYVTYKNQLSVWGQELKTMPIPGQSGLDYSHECLSNGNENGVETQFANYAQRSADLRERIAGVSKQVELVRRTIEHFKLEHKAKGKKHYDYICARWLKRMSYHRAAIECGIPERTSDFWIEEIFTIAEAIADEYNLF